MTELQCGQGLQSFVTYTLGTFSNLDIEYIILLLIYYFSLYLLLECLTYTSLVSSRYLL